MRVQIYHLFFILQLILCFFVRYLCNHLISSKQIMIISLIGYMASGKTAIGQELARIKDLNFMDLDAYIESREEMTIPQIFESKGEIYFRKIEGEYLSYVLENSDNLVLSHGGGTPCYGNNMKL